MGIAVNSSQPQRATPDWSEAAEDWLTAKRVGRRSGDLGHSDRARRGDLIRWAAAINAVQGRKVEVDSGSLAGWGFVMTEVGDAGVLLRALDHIGDNLAASTRQRMLSTLRGFCSYLVRRGLLTADPSLEPELKVSNSSTGEILGFTEADIDLLVVAAGRVPTPREHARWPTRDIAIIRTLHECGLRVGEICTATIATYDTKGEQPILRIRDAKGGKHRVAPVPSPAVTAIDDWLTERAEILGAPTPRDTLFVRSDGRPLNQQFIDRTLRSLARLAGIATPEGAMAHALRHSYGDRLARRGVALPIIQQLMGHADPRTTSLYTAVHAQDLTHALREAGLL